MKYILLSIMVLGLFSCDNESLVDQQTLPEISASPITVAETDQEQVIDINIELSEAISQPIILNYSTQDGTAISGTDYKNLSAQTLTFEAGDLQKKISITIFGDVFKENKETFTLQLISAINASIATPEVEITITDTDTEEGSTEFTIPSTGYTTPTAYDGYNLVWQDEFNAEAIEDHWIFETGTGSSGWGNNELQYYRKENTSLMEGSLVIEAKKESFGGSSYTSSRIISRGNAEFQYGRIDIRAVLPKGQGLWPALWMLGSNFPQVGWPKCGEIDIMEMVGGNGRENNVIGTLHWDNAGSYACTCGQGNGYTLSNGTFADEFNVFSIIWDANKIEWLVNDQSFKTIDISPTDLSEFRAKFFFILNIAVGGNLPGPPNTSTQFPQYMAIDYIRVFQKP